MIGAKRSGNWSSPFAYVWEPPGTRALRRLPSSRDRSRDGQVVASHVTAALGMRPHLHRLTVMTELDRGPGRPTSRALG